MDDETGRRLDALGTTRSGMQPNVAAALAYVFTIVTGPIILMIERENKYVRFHAVQAILYGVVWILLWMFFGIAVNEIWFVPTFMWIFDALLHFIIMLGGLVILLLLIYRTYKGEKIMLPILGRIAEKLV
ncbi:MAG TPA: hypothetical protein VMH06_01945 [Thermodesulfovibrionales bacterium]|nr:hypothetical protein [Thermodesulfovibrionales bacterium]